MKNRKQKVRSTYQILEPRKMLAGDVTVELVGDLLTITGDAESNEITVVGLRDGTATVIAAEGTTINGGTADFIASNPLDDVVVRLGEGDDSATLRGLVLSQSLRVDLGAGNDRTDINHIDVGRFEEIAGDGDDVLEFHNVYSRKSILILGEDGDDTVSITAMAAGTNINVVTADGDDTVAIDNLGNKKNLNINTGAGDDAVLTTGEVFGYRTNFLLGAGNDSLNVLPELSSETALFFRSLNVQAGDGDDIVALDSSVTSRRQTTINGNAGDDSIERNSALLVDGNVSNFEATEVADFNAVLDSVFTTLTDLDIDTTPFGRQSLTEPALTTTTQALIQNENGGASELDPDLIVGGNTTTFTGATVSLGTTFVSGQDSFAFVDNSTTDSIIGIVDATTGDVTLTGDGTDAQYQAALGAITFNNTSDDPDTSARTATITLSNADGEDLTATRAITVVAVADAPVISGVPATVTVDLSDSPTAPVLLAGDDLVLTDADSTQISSAVVAIDDSRVTGDVLAFTPVTGITGTFDDDTGVLTLTGDADVVDYQTVLRSVTFDQTDDTPGQLIITLVATDAQGNTSAETAVTVNLETVASVTLAGSAQAPVFREAGDPVNIDTLLELDGESTATITEARVEITSGLDTVNDVLTYDRGFASANDIEVFGSADVLIFSSALDVPASVETYQALLRSVAFHTNDSALSEATSRTIEYGVTSDTEFVLTKDVALTPRTEAERTEDIDLRDDRLIQEFVAENNLTTQVTDSGLHYIISTEGTGPLPSATDEILVNYTGTYLNGVKFDANDEADFFLNEVIEGWTEGFQLIPEGSSGTFLIPSRLAYGSGTGGGSIATNAILRFDFDFLEIL